MNCAFFGLFQSFECHLRNHLFIPSNDAYQLFNMEGSDFLDSPSRDHIDVSALFVTFTCLPPKNRIICSYEYST